VNPALLAAARTLAVDGWTAEAVRELRAAGEHALLLKGPTVARWLYGSSGERTYVDVDILVAGDRLAQTRAILAGLGYELRDPEGEKEFVSGTHAEGWWRRADGAQIDLHHNLPGGDYPEGVVWPLLWARAETMDVAGESVRVLDLPSRTLLIALHAAHHGSEVATPLEDLRRALEQVPDRTWRDAVTIADELTALPQLAAGLELVPGGPELARRLHLPAVAELEATRNRQMAPGFARLGAATPRERLRLMRDAAFPSRAFMHWRVPWSRGSRARLVLAYVYRCAWLATHAAPGWLAWQRARGGEARGPVMRQATRVALVAEIAVAYAQAKLLMRRTDLPRTLERLRRQAPQRPAATADLSAGARLGRIVGRVLARLPTDSRCLIQSLVLTRLLDRRGIPSVLVIGVRPGEDFGAHSWLEVGGQPIQDAGGTDFPRLAEL
jgi:hypothetical protein